jgi:tetratricopeptide (TPR) repeat protein
MRESKRYWFEPVYTFCGLQLYKVHLAFVDKPPANPLRSVAPDTTNADGYLRWGRTLLLRGNYSGALWEFAHAYAEGANPALSIYQMTVAFAMSGQQFEATKALSKLYRLPQSTSYIPAARLHLRMMDSYFNAENAKGTVHRPEELLNIAAFYWNFGYYDHGLSILQEALSDDSTYFVGLLWGWNYATDLGDTKQAAGYLGILESIDATNPVVQGYRALTAVDDSLHRVKSPSEQSRLLLEKGRIYWSIGLYDEAYDCVERSIGADRRNPEPYQYLIQLFESTKKPWAVRRVRMMMQQLK